MKIITQRIFNCLVALVFFASANVVAQTNPAAFALSGGNFSFTTQTATNTTYPTNIQGWNNGGTANVTSLPTAASTADIALTANASATTTGIGNLGANGFNFLSSGTSNTVGALALSLNTTGRTNVLVSWTAQDQTAAGRQMNLALQYRVGTTGVFTTVAGSTYSTSATSALAAQNFTNVALPAAADNQAVVQLRWIYWESPSGTGARDAIRLDDITVSSSAVSTAAMDFVNVQFPNSTQNITEGTSLTFYTQGYEPTVTEADGAGAGVSAWIGYSTTNQSPNTGTWTWVPATFNSQVGNNDEFQATLSGLAPGTYYVASRWQLNGGPYVYGGTAGIWNNTGNNVQVNVAADVVNFANIQFPATATITQGSSVPVYAQVYEPGTEAAGALAGISGWIGYSSTNNAPSNAGWTWVPATFNVQAGNNDEYVASIGSSLTPGTYYYASRFLKSTSSTYVYGGTNGVWSNDSGVLTVVSAQEINVLGNSVSITDGDTTPATADHTDFGSISTVGASVVRTFTIQNTGGTVLNLGANAVTLSATNGFSVTTQPATTVAPNGSTTFQVTFDPSVGGAETVMLNIANNDSNENPYNFNITGTGVVPTPEINVLGNAITIVDGDVTPSATDNTAFGAVNINAGTVSYTYTIQNTGTANLVLDTPAVVLLNSGGGFTITSQPTSPVAPSGSTTFTVTFDPSVATAETNTVLIGSNDSDEAVYSFDVSGSGTIDTPVANAATNITPTGFTANWGVVPGALSYQLDVSTSSTFGTSTPAMINEGFNGGTTAPAGWNFVGITGTYTSAGNFGASSPSLQFDTTSDRVQTIILDGPATQLSFWVKGQGTTANGSSLLIEGYNGTAWSTIQNITTIPLVATTYTYGAATTPALPSNILMFRFTYTKTTGNVAFDDVMINYNAFTPSFVTGYNNLNVGNVTSYNVTGLSPETTYYYRVRAVAGGASANSTTISVTTDPAAVTWNGTAWSNTVGPDADIEAIIAGVYSTASNGAFTAKKVTVNSGSLTVSSGTDLTIQNELVNNLTAADVVVENNGNLIQVNNIANTGEITVNRNSSALMRLDYTLWSSPVLGQNLLDFSPETTPTRFYTYNTATDAYNPIDPSTNDFEIAKGYLIRMPNNHPTSPTIWNGSFEGVPNNGNINFTMSLAGQGFNLTGNPYPSPIDPFAFVAANSANIEPTLYFWRKTNNANTDSYVTWNNGTFVSTNETDVTGMEDVIRQGQGFFVDANGNSANLVYTNSMRIGDNSDEFFRNANELVAEKSRIWLNLTNAEGAFAQTALVYVDGANSTGVDTFDGRYINDGTVSINTIINGAKYAINGRSAFVASDVVALNLDIATAGTYSISIGNLDGLFAGDQNIYLRDNTSGIVHDLKSAPYEFTTEAGSFASRFDVLYEQALSVNNPDFTENNVQAFAQGGSVKVNSGSAIMSEVTVFDLRGRRIATVKNIDASEVSIPVAAANQMLIVRITSENGSVISKKVMN